MQLDHATSLTIKAQVKGEQEIRGLRKGLNQLSDQSKKTAGAMDRLKMASRGVLGALRTLLPVLGVAAFAKMTNDVLQLGDQLEKMSRSTGLTVPLLDKLRQSAALAGTDFKALQRAFPTLAKNMQDASDGIGTAKEAFDRLGFSVTDSQGNLKDLDTAFLELTDKFAAMEDGTMKAANAAEIFGTGLGRKLIPLLNQGKDAIDGLNTAFSQESAEKMAAFNDKWAQLGERFREVAINLTIELLPHLERLLDLLESMVSAFTSLPGPIQALVVAVTALGLALVVIAPILPALVAGFKLLAGLKLVVIFAGWASKLALLLPVIKTLGVAIVAVFTAPAAPFILAGVAVAGLIAALVKFKGFRQVFINIGKGAWEMVKKIAPIADWILNWQTKLITMFVNYLKNNWTKVKEILMAPFNYVVEFIPKLIQKMIDAVEKTVKDWWDGLMRLIGRGRDEAREASNTNSGSSSTTSVKGYAEGGFVSGPTLAVVGEGKAGGEYLVPSHKVGGFINNYLSGMRGGAAIPSFAEGGFVSGGNPNINIKTGPVISMNGQQYITVDDLQSALYSFSNSIFSNSRSIGGRRFQGIS